MRVELRVEVKEDIEYIVTLEAPPMPWDDMVHTGVDALQKIIGGHRV